MGKRGSDSALLKSHHALSVLPADDGSLAIAFPARIHDGANPYPCCSPSSWYPWDYSGLMRFELRGTTAADASLRALPALVTDRGNPATPGSWNSYDAAASSARSVLFRNGTAYVAHGRFWHRDNVGTIVGPY